VRRLGWLAALSIFLVTACAGDENTSPGASPSSQPTPSPSPSASIAHPTEYFNLSEEDALSYLAGLEERALEALHDGNLGALHDIYTSDGPARREAAATIMREFRHGLVDRTEIDVVSTEVLEIHSQLAVFREVRLVYPCVWTYDDRTDVTPDHRVIRQVLIRSMADEYLNWRLDHDEITNEHPTGEKVTVCP
jgi:hypothetical protein